jgi:hypothetical protein
MPIRDSCGLRDNDSPGAEGHNYAGLVFGFPVVVFAETPVLPQRVILASRLVADVIHFRRVINTDPQSLPLASSRSRFPRT